jgi:hypothetical protein
MLSQDNGIQTTRIQRTATARSLSFSTSFFSRPSSPTTTTHPPAVCIDLAHLRNVLEDRFHQEIYSALSQQLIALRKNRLHGNPIKWLHTKMYTALSAPFEKIKSMTAKPSEPVWQDELDAFWLTPLRQLDSWSSQGKYQQLSDELEQLMIAYQQIWVTPSQDSHALLRDFQERLHKLQAITPTEKHGTHRLWRLLVSIFAFFSAIKRRITCRQPAPVVNFSTLLAIIKQCTSTFEKTVALIEKHMVRDLAQYHDELDTQTIEDEQVLLLTIPVYDNEWCLMDAPSSSIRHYFEHKHELSCREVKLNDAYARQPALAHTQCALHDDALGQHIIPHFLQTRPADYRGGDKDKAFKIRILDLIAEQAKKINLTWGTLSMNQVIQHLIAKPDNLLAEDICAYTHYCDYLTSMNRITRHSLRTLPNSHSDVAAILNDHQLSTASQVSLLLLVTYIIEQGSAAEETKELLQAIIDQPKNIYFIKLENYDANHREERSTRALKTQTDRYLCLLGYLKELFTYDQSYRTESRMSDPLKTRLRFIAQPHINVSRTHSFSEWFCQSPLLQRRNSTGSINRPPVDESANRPFA